MTPHLETQQPTPQAVSRLGLYLPLAFLVVIVSGWCGFWFYCARLAETHLSALKAQEAERGRTWACADQTIGGFPFRIELHCSALSLSAVADGRVTQVQVGEFHAATQIYSPSLALADVTGPMVVASEGSTTTARWDALRVSMRFSNQLDRLSLALTTPQIETTQPGGVAIVARAGAAEAHVRYDSGRPAEDNAVDLALQIKQMASPAADIALGSPETMDVALSGVATKLANLRFVGWSDMLDGWRTAGGVFLLDAGKVGKGGLQIESKGTLNLDPMRRLGGKLDISARGLGPLVARFGGGGVSQLIGPLFTRKDGSPTQLPLQFQDGRIQVGPFRTGAVLQPLY